MSSVRTHSSTPKWPFYSCYLVLSAAGLYYMHLSSANRLALKLVRPLSTSSVDFAYPGHPDVIIRRRYTGLLGPDTILSMIVTAFLAGPAGFEQHIRMQNAEFLFNFIPLLTVISIEAVRCRKWSLIVFTSIWAIFYQGAGAAVIIPLYIIAHDRAFSKIGAARIVPPAWAKTLLPAVILGSLLPSALMLYPFANIDHTMLAIAFWQPSPILVNLIWVSLKQAASSSGHSVSHLRRPLVLTGSIALAVHIYTLYACLSDSDPTVILSSIFLPRQRLAVSLTQAVHFIFQMDYLVVFLAAIVWCLQVRAEDRAAAGKAGSILAELALVGSSVVLLGPGATLSWVWYERLGRAGLKKA